MRSSLYEVNKDTMQNSAQTNIKTSFIDKISTEYLTRYWEDLVLTSIILNALIVGFQASFNSSIVWLVATSYVLDAFFIVDIFLQFIMSYNENGTQITSFSKKVKHYVTTIFFIDLFSIFPFELLGATNHTMEELKEAWNPTINAFRIMLVRTRSSQ